MTRVTLLSTFILVATWLLLNGPSVPQFLLGLVLAMGLLTAFVRPVRRSRIRNPHIALALAFHVLLDIVRANLAVARLAMRRGSITHSGFLEVPLELHDPYALTVLAMIVTSTPGTVWGGLSPNGTTLHLHVLDLKDPDGLTRTIKERYERPLKRIFE
jgi:multicomponent K+:H+ antiporter subunit E